MEERCRWKTRPPWRYWPPPVAVPFSAAALAGQLATTRFVVQRVLMPAVIVFGVLANSVNIAVLTQSCPWVSFA